MTKFTDKFTDNSDLEFLDISNELWREYEFPSGDVIRIELPAAVAVGDKHRESGGNGHRIVDFENISHYIPAGWIRLSWKVYEGGKPYNF